MAFPRPLTYDPLSVQARQQIPVGCHPDTINPSRLKIAT
jgi:hypothetical protein